jgi:hypothetical protein
MHLATMPLTLVNKFILDGKTPESFSFTFEVRALVSGAVLGPSLDSLAMLSVKLPLALVHISDCISENTVGAMSHGVEERTFVDVANSVNELAIAMSVTHNPVSFVRGTVFPENFSFAISKATKPRPTVCGPCRILENSWADMLLGRIEGVWAQSFKNLVLGKVPRQTLVFCAEVLFLVGLRLCQKPPSIFLKHNSSLDLFEGRILRHRFPLERVESREEMVGARGSRGLRN